MGMVVLMTCVERRVGVLEFLERYRSVEWGGGGVVHKWLGIDLKLLWIATCFSPEGKFSEESVNVIARYVIYQREFSMFMCASW